MDTHAANLSLFTPAIENPSRLLFIRFRLLSMAGLGLAVFAAALLAR